MDDIPNGWVRVADYDHRASDDHKSGPKGDYARIIWQLRNHPGKEIRAYRDGSQWVANKADIDAFLRAFHASKDARRSAVAKPTLKATTAENHSDCDQVPGESDLGVLLHLMEMRLTLGRIESILERLAVAAESIATQPKASDAEGSWRGVNGECV